MAIALTTATILQTTPALFKRRGPSVSVCFAPCNVNIVACSSDYRKVHDWLFAFIAPYTFTTRDYRQYSAIADLYTLHYTVTHTHTR
jgi:hypothetical protein